MVDSPAVTKKQNNPCCDVAAVKATVEPKQPRSELLVTPDEPYGPAEVRWRKLQFGFSGGLGLGPARLGKLGESAPGGGIHLATRLFPGLGGFGRFG